MINAIPPPPSSHRSFMSLLPFTLMIVIIFMVISFIVVGFESQVLKGDTPVLAIMENRYHA